MGGFVRGIGVGLASFALGFVVLSVVVPVDQGPAPAAVTTELATDGAVAPVAVVPETVPPDGPMASSPATPAPETVAAVPAVRDPAALGAPVAVVPGAVAPETIAQVPAAPEPVAAVAVAPETPAPEPVAEGPAAAPQQTTAPLPPPPGAPALPATSGDPAPGALVTLGGIDTGAVAAPPPPVADAPAEAATRLETLPTIAARAVAPLPPLPASGAEAAPSPLAAPDPLPVASTPVPLPTPDAPVERSETLAALAPVSTPLAPAAPPLPVAAADSGSPLTGPAALDTTTAAIPAPAADTPAERSETLAALAPVAAPPGPATPPLPVAAAEAGSPLTGPAALDTTTAATPIQTPDAPAERSETLAAVTPVSTPPAPAAPILPGAGGEGGDALPAPLRLETGVAPPPPAEAEDTPTERDARLAALSPVLTPPAPGDPALPATGADASGGLPAVAPVAAARTPAGEPLLPGVEPDRPPVSTLPTVVPGVVVSRGSLGDDSAVRRGGGETSGRLPTIGAPAATPPEPAAPDDTRPAVERFAATPALAADQQPLGLVLTDDPSAETAILALPVPVTIALDPYDSDAPRRAAAYRAAGHEIALQAVDVPALATPADLAQLIDGWQRAFPEAVAILDVPVNGLGANPALARDFAAMLEPQGLGAISLRDGLDAFLQASRASGLRAGSVYRLIEGGDQSEFTIRRLIDRAAFEALRQPGILIAGSAADRDTMRELADFARGAGRAGVALAPASAVLGRN